MMSRLLSTLGCLVLAALAAGTGWWAYSVAESQPALPPAPGDSAFAISSAPSVAPTQALSRPRRPDVYYAAITQRPLFAPDRRPATLTQASQSVPRAVPVAPEPVSPPPAPVLRLLGTIGTADGIRALVASDGTDPDWIIEQTNLGGWTVSLITPEFIEISRDNDTFRVDMYRP